MVDARNDLSRPVLAVALELDRHVQQALHLGAGSASRPFSSK
jgi:hypothetical protein